MTEVCSQYFYVNTQWMFYTLPVILIIVSRWRYVFFNNTNWYLCPSARDNIDMYITKFNIAITMIISMFEDRGMWVDIFMFAMCQHLYVYNNSCFHMFLDIIGVFKSVSGWYILEYDDSTKGFIHDIICQYFLWYVHDIVLYMTRFEKKVCGCVWLIFLCI